MIGDLVSRLLAAIEQREERTKRAREWMGPRFTEQPARMHTERGAEVSGHPGYVMVAGMRIWDAEEDLRRCVADRKMIQLHATLRADDDPDDPRMCLECCNEWPCETLQITAEGYGLT